MIQNLPCLYIFFFPFTSQVCVAPWEVWPWVKFFVLFFFRKSILLDHFHGFQHLVLMEKVKIVLWLSIYLFRCVSGESSTLFLSFFRWSVQHITVFQTKLENSTLRAFIYIFTHIPWRQTSWDIDLKILITKEMAKNVIEIISSLKMDSLGFWMGISSFSLTL